ncbi:MAG TPA: TlpA disulfide reductase family protein [Nitrospiria bacterium]|nr:TlpA disulfide reductase family protein [Nitrospiria bacterium]
MKSALRFIPLVLLLWISAAPAIQAGQNSLAPPFKVTTLDGKVISTDSLKGKATLIMFWASWCHVCQHEMPNVKNLYDHQKDKLQFLAIGFADEEANIRKYVHDHAKIFAFPVGYDRGDRISSEYFVRGTPTFFLLNAKGEVVASHLGGGFLNNRVFQDFILSL